nr:MAG: CcdB protein [Bacteriophage sp.]
MYKNAEGYRDETACRAIIAVEREERIKRRKLQEDKDMGTENKTGEVWRTRTVTGTEKIVLVVADHGTLAYVNHLAEEGIHTDIEVNCEGLRYGSSDKMYYVPYRNFEEYLRTVSDEQLADVKNKLAASIGIEPQIVEKEVIRQVPVEAPSAAVPTKTEKECDAEVQELMIRAEKAEALLEEYRELYRKVIEKI